jgi:glutamate carboxypeptidase
MDSVIRSLLALLQERNQIMIDQLHEFCSINSGSGNLRGLALTHQALSAAFLPVADSVESLSLPETDTLSMQGELIKLSTGNALLIRKRPNLKRRVLLAGHMDTVFSETHPFQCLTYINHNQVNGPGVADMKGGLIVLLHALMAFEETDASKSLGWDVIINADEEIGSPASSALFADLAPQYQAALLYEPAMDVEGTLARNRKGSGKFTVLATGKSAHAGRMFHEGRNAIS